MEVSKSVIFTGTQLTDPLEHVESDCLVEVYVDLVESGQEEMFYVIDKYLAC